jgi:hypothetical protein
LSPTLNFVVPTTDQINALDVENAKASTEGDGDGRRSAPQYEDRYDTTAAEKMKVRFDLLGDSFNHLSAIKDSGTALSRAGVFLLDSASVRAARLEFDAQAVYDRIGSSVVKMAKEDVDLLIAEVRACKTELAEEPETVARFHTYNEMLDVGLASSWRCTVLVFSRAYVWWSRMILDRTMVACLKSIIRVIQ